MESTLPGLAVVAIGLAHFAVPQYFDPINGLAFPRNPRRHTYVNGAIETLIGALLVSPNTRVARNAVSAAYVCHLLINLLHARVVARRGENAMLSADR